MDKDTQRYLQIFGFVPLAQARTHWVYCLFREGALVYVGMTGRSVYQRVAEHRRGGMAFDRVMVRQVDGEEEARQMEANTIYHLRPSLNVAHPSTEKWDD